MPAGSSELASLTQTWRRLAWENPGLDTHRAALEVTMLTPYELYTTLGFACRRRPALS